ncbi:MAG: phosphoribosyltransferase [Francisellaceae bacterium]
MQKYHDRSDAGQTLANLLINDKNHDNTIVLALPRGGVPIGYEIAKALKLPLDVFVVKKLGAPFQEELAIGAIAENNVLVLNDDIIDALGINQQQIENILKQKKQELATKVEYYSQARKRLNIKSRTVILVDDGIATGSTIKAAIKAIQSMNPATIIVAVPVASSEAVVDLKFLTDKLICPIVSGNFHAVGQFYENFDQTQDEEVKAILKKRLAAERQP